MVNNSADTAGTSMNVVGTTLVVAAGSSQTTNTADTSGSQTANTAVTSGNNTTGPGSILLTERYFSDSSWPRDMVLDLNKSNWPEWNKCLTLAASRQGFSSWLNGTLPCPDVNTSPRAHWIWNGSDESLRSFILEYISNIDYEGLGALAQNGSAHAVYVALKQRHEKLRLWA